MEKVVPIEKVQFNVKSLLASVLILIAGHVSGQSIEPPKHEPFSFRLSEDHLQVTRGSENAVNLTLLKSKQYTNSKVKLSSASTLPAGLSVRFSHNDEVFYNSAVTVAASDQTVAGTYSLVVNCTVAGKSKSTILKVVVN